MPVVWLIIKWLIRTHCILEYGTSMIVPEELALGLLLVTSAFFLALAVTSYRRSGMKAILATALGLAAHVVATFIIVVATLINDSVDDTLRLYLVIADAAALAAILVLGFVGGRARG